MGYAQFVGRVGALAVALGVTNVVGHPLIAWAEEPSAESSNTDSAPSTGTPSTGTPDKPSETQSPDPTTAPTRDPVDTEDADATDVETGTDVSVVETSYPTTTPAPETEEATAPQPKTVTDDAPQAKDPHPTETEPAPTATDTDDSPETTEQRRFVAQALAVSGVNEQSLDAPLATRLAIPVAADLATSSAAPEAAVSITKVDPVTVEEAHPFRSLVLGFLGIFGFDPTPGATNDALLTALWAAYRGYERRFENETPTVSGATIVSTSQTEDGYTAVRISVGFTDPDGDTLHYSTTNGHAGTLTANTDGTFTYLTNTVGTDTVTITANDDDGTGHLHGLLGWLFKPAAGHTRTVTLALNITGSINHAPVGTDDTATTNEDTPVVIHVLANDTDPDNDPLSIGSFSNGAHGTVTLDGDTLTYTPDQNYNGTDEFSYTTTDGTLASLTTHVFITINPVNDAPVITVSAVGQPDPTTGVVVGHVTATDVDGDALTYSGTATTTHGSVTVDTDGTFTYTPTADARHAAAADGVGTVTDSFTVTVSDSHGGVANATLTPTVAPQNTAPSFNTAGAITILGLGTDWPTKIVYSPNGSHAYTVVTTHDPDTDSDSFSLAVIDTTTNAFTKIPLSGYVDANSLTVSPNGGRVYAVGASNGDSPVYSLTVFDTASNTISSIPFTGYVYNPLLGITVSPDSSHVYLSSLDSTNYVYVANIFDPAANSVVSVPLAPRFYPYQPSFNSDGSKVYLTAGGDYTTGYQQTLSQIDSSTGVINTINLPSLPQNFTFSSDGTRAYATFSANTGGQLAVIDTATLTTTWITIPAISRTMVISPDNRYVYATASDNTLMVVDTTTTAVTNIALVGSEFMQDLLAVAPDGNTAYVVTGSGPFSNFDYQDHSLEIVDLTTHNITAIPLASRPLEVTVSPDGTFVYLNDYDPEGSHSAVLIIDTATNTPTYFPTDGRGSWLAISSDSRWMTDLRVSTSDEGTTYTLLVIDTAAKTATTIPLPGTVGPSAFRPDGLQLYAWSGDGDGNYSLLEVSLGSGTTIGTPDQASGLVTGVLAATDADGDQLAYALAGGASHGTATVYADGTFSYTPTAEARHDAATGGATTDTFTVTVVDGHGGSATTSITVTVAPETATPPHAGADAAVTDEDTPVTVAVLANDTGNGTLSVTAVSQPGHGSVAVNANGTLTYTPDANYNGDDNFTYTVTDGTTTSNTATVTITITPINDAPVAYDATVHNVSENSTTSATLANLVTDIDHDTLTLEVVDQPELGSVTFITNTGFYYYAPTEFGTATSTTFTYRAFDGTSYSNTATVTIEFVNTNGAPTAADDNLNTDEDTPVTIHVLANDTDPDGDPLSIDTHTWINHGSLTLNADGTFTYTPEENYSGSDEFSYTLTDGTTTGNTATVHITVNPVNDAPIGGADTATTDENTAVVITSAQLLANDYDIEGDALTIASVSSAGSGSATLNADGSITFIPEEGFTGIDSFTYRVSDGTAESNDVVVFVTVAPVNDAPVIDSVVSTPGVGNTWVVTVSAHDPDYGDTVTVGLAAIDTAHVGISANPNGSFTVTLTDTAWAAAHPGTQVLVIASATDGASNPVTTAVAIGTLNNAIAVGNNVDGQNSIPALPAGLTYTQIAAGAYHTVLLRSDGTAVATGNNQVWQSSIPALPAGLTYTQVAAGGFHTVLLRSDGTAFAIGDNGDGQNNIPDLPAGLTYTQIAAGYYDTVLLRSDGTAIAIGNNYYGQNNIPALPAGLTYTQIAAGTYHSVLLLSDGNAIATGYNYFGQASIPALPAGLTYTQVAAGGIHTVLLRSDGTAIATGYNGDGQNNIPDLPAGLTYTQIAAGDYDTVLLRSDGTAIATGYNAYGQTDIPTLPSGVTYTQITAGAYHTVLLTAVGSGPVAV